MVKSSVFSIVLIFFMSLCSAQETGCFKTEADSSVSLETNIDFSKYDAFFVGEFHGVYATPAIKLSLIKYLNQHNGITDVFMEIGYSAAYLYNAYLSTGDTTLITQPILLYEYKKPEIDFWKRLYEYNKTLDHKVTIRGMDFERVEFLKVLKLLLPKGKEKPVEIVETLSFIDTINVDRISRVDDIQDTLYERIRYSMTRHTDAYEQFYGASFKIVAGIMFNVNTFRKFNARNKTMYHNMMKQMEESGVKKFVAFNGAQHAMKDRGILCGDLNRSKVFKNKLVDIVFTCKNCYDYNGTFSHPGGTTRPFETPYRSGTDMSNEYDRYFNATCKYTLLPSELSDKKKVQKYSDYIILIKDQPKF